MLNKDLHFYKDTANKIRFLRDETGLFERFVDVFIIAGVVGMLFNKKGKEQVDKNRATIFLGQLSNEALRIKYFSSLAFLIENNDTNTDEHELLKQTFSDWFSNKKSDDESIENAKYKIFKEYAIGGIDILYECVVGESTSKEGYLRNFYNFIKKIDEENIGDNYDRAILGGLVG